MTRLAFGQLKPLFWQYAAASALVFVTFGLITSFTIESLREGRIRELQVRTRDIAGIFSEHMERLFSSLEWMSDMAANAYAEHQNDPQALMKTLEKINIRDKFSLQLSVVDSNGIFVASNVSAQGGMDLRDREHIKAHFETPDLRFYVSKPLVGRVSGQLSINISRRVADNPPNGGCIIVASYDPKILNDFFERNDFDQDGVITLARTDGTLLARSKGSEGAIGMDLSNSDRFKRLSTVEKSGSFLTQSMVDGHERYYSFKLLEPFGLVVIVGAGSTAALSGLDTVTRIAAGWMLLLGSAFILGGALLVKFIGQQKAFLEASVREREAKNLASLLEAAFQSSGILVVIFDHTNKITFMNRTAQALAARLECKPEKLLGSLIGSDIESNLHTQISPSSRIVISEREQRSLFWTIAPAEWISPTSQIGVGFDRTDIEATERVLYQRARLTMLGEMATGLAHEMAQPLTVISFAAKMISNSKDENTKESIDLLTTAADRVARTVDNMKIFGRRGNNNLSTRIRYSDSIANIELLTRNDLALSSIMLTVDEASDDTSAVGDPALFDQVLLNLVMNARDAINAVPQDQASRPREIKITTGALDADRAFVRVKDTGVGISAAAIPKVFEPFFTTKANGSGLGLSLSYGIVTDMGGSITFSSSSEGTEFEVALPVG